MRYARGIIELFAHCKAVTLIFISGRSSDISSATAVPTKSDSYVIFCFGRLSTGDTFVTLKIHG